MVTFCGVNFNPPAPTWTGMVSALELSSEIVAAQQTINANLIWSFMIFSLDCGRSVLGDKVQFCNNSVTFHEPLIGCEKLGID
jgi:hypothetical protein